MNFTMQLRRTNSRTKTRQTASQKFTKRRRSNSTCQKSSRCVCCPMPSSPVEHSEVWSELRSRGQLCDGIVYCSDGESFKIHRAILSAASPYFRALFTNSIGRDEFDRGEAHVEGDGKIFSLLLDFAYTGTCKVTASNVEDLLKYADQYEFLGVVHLCCKILLEEMCPANCLGIMQFANQYFCTDLERRGERFVRHNFARIVLESNEFVYLDKIELKEIIGDDEVNVKREEIIFDAVVKWTAHSPGTRKCHFLDLLKCVRFGSVTRDGITVAVKHPFVRDNQQCKNYMDNVIAEIDSASSGASAPSFFNPIFRPRLSYDVLFAIGGWSAGTPTNFVETYDVRADRWLISSDTDSNPRAYHGLCALNGQIYVVGGFDGRQYFNSVRRFDPVAHTWHECACMYHHRCYVSVVMYDSKIYALGGYNGRARMNSAERYDPVTNQWEMLPPMLKQRSDASAAALNDKIYIVGGFNGQEVMRSAEIFDIKLQQWCYIAQMNTARSGVSLVAYENTLYALGGFNGYVRLTSGEKFIPGESTWWTNISEMMTPRSNFATAVLDDYIYAIGGFNGSSTINFVECYEPETDYWYDASPMNLNRSAMSACVIGGLPNNRDYSVLGRNQQESGGVEIDTA